jgi:hypothetical protein
MTKLETIQILLGQNDEIVDMLAQTWSDEKVLKNWNYRDQTDNKGLRLIQKGNEFEIEFYVPLNDFFKAAWLDLASTNTNYKLKT